MVVSISSVVPIDHSICELVKPREVLKIFAIISAIDIQVFRKSTAFEIYDKVLLSFIEIKNYPF